MRPERAGEAEEDIFPDGDAQAGAQKGGARQGTGGGWQTPVFLAAVGASGVPGKAPCAAPRPAEDVCCGREEKEKGTSLPEQEVPQKNQPVADAV